MKRLIFLCTVFLLSGCASYQPDRPYSSSQGSSIVRTARNLIGAPYHYGGSSPQTGFDCSGFVRYVYGRYGFELPHSAKALSGYGDRVSLSSLKPGDLVFFQTNGSSISHVGIYSGHNQFIHAPSSGKSVEEIRLKNHPYWGGRIVKAARLV